MAIYVGRAVAWLLMLVTSCLGAACGAPMVKDQPPVNAVLHVSAEELVKRDEMHVTLRFRPVLADAARITVELRSKGAVAATGDTRAEFHSVSANQEMEWPATLVATGLGEGELRAVVTVYGEDGTLEHQTIPWLHFLVTEEEVLAGREGTLVLKLEHLEHLRQWGKISELEYQRERQRLQGGGAQSNIRQDP